MRVPAFGRGTGAHADACDYTKGSGGGHRPGLWPAATSKVKCMQSTTRGNEGKAATRRWVARFVWAMVAVASVGLITVGSAAAVASTITVHVLSDTTPQNHKEGVAYDGTGGNAQIPIATFVDSDGCPTTCQLTTVYSATVQWSAVLGDTSTCPAVGCSITLTDATTGTYTILATHTFKDEFNCQPTPCVNAPVTVTVSDTDGQSASADNVSGTNTCDPSATSPCLGIAIKDQVLTGSPQSFSGTVGVAIPNSTIIGTFLDANPQAAITDPGGSNSEYSVSVDWADGTGADTSATVTKGACNGSGCTMSVHGGHTYTAGNTYPVKVTVQDGLDFQFKITITSTATIANDSGSACTSATLVGSSSTEFIGKVITFRGGGGPCSSPQFQFWFKSAGGSWVVMQKFSPTATWTWDTSKWARGTYYIDVWANQNGQPSTSAQAFAITTVNLTVGPACTSVGLNPDKPSSQQSGTIITFTATASPCPYPEYEFWVQATGGPWILGRGYGNGTYVWNTAGDGATSYNVDVWAREKGSTASQQTFSLVPYSLTAPQPCTAATLNPAPPSPQASGTTVTFTAGSSTCSQPQYLFYVQATGGPWILGRTWGSNTYVWKTTGNGKTTYNIDVWVRQNGSTAAHEAFAVVSYQLT
jgi:hypothetical protein